MSRKIVILGTGGTIAGTGASATDAIGYTAAQVGVDRLVAAIPVLGQWALQMEQVAQIDSKDMDFEVWRQLALRCAHWLADPGVQAVVVTHGTDTLEETAWFLQAALQPTKPVVLACAMRPANALMADGPQNLLDAMAVASHPGARGVVAVCAGTVHLARDVQKVHTYRLDAFDSGDAGPLGHVEDGALRLLRNWPEARPEWAPGAIKKIAGAVSWPRVEVVMNYAGAGGGIVDALCAQGVQGLVAACTGNGTLNHVLEAALLRAQAAGVRVVRATRCAGGRVLARPGDALADSQGLSPVKARVALMLELLGIEAKEEGPRLHP